MPLQVHCPNCNASMRLPDAARNKSLRCGSCRAVFKIRPAESAPPDITAGPATRAPRPPQSEAIPVLPETDEDESDEGASGSSWLGKVILCTMALLLLGGVGVGGLWYFLGRKAAPPLSQLATPSAEGGSGAAGNAAKAPAADEERSVSGSIKPAPLDAERTVLKLPEAARSVCVGGGGRYLILHLPTQNQLAVFDTNEARLVKQLPVAPGDVKIAAGLDKLVVFGPLNSVFERWDLTTFEREASVPCPAPVQALAMGCASRGPLIVQTLAEGNPQTKTLVCLDLQTLRPSDIQPTGGFIPPANNPGIDPAGTLRVSANGKVITGSFFGVWVRDGDGYRQTRGPVNSCPDAEGRLLYTPGQAFATDGKPIGPRLGQAGARIWLLPAPHGPYFLSLEEQNGIGSLGVHLAADQRRLVGLSNVTGLGSLVAAANAGVPLDGHLFFVPDARLLAVLSVAKQELVLYRADIEQLLEKSGVDYLFVSSQPPTRFKPGTAYSYQLEVRSRRGGVEYRLESGPPGMTLSPQGRLSWDVPAAMDAEQTKVAVRVSDNSKQEVLHAFVLQSHDRPPVALGPEAPQEAPPPIQLPMQARREQQVEPNAGKDPDRVRREVDRIRRREALRRMRQAPVQDRAPPRDVASEAPLVRTPAQILSLVPAPLKEARRTLALPGPVRDVCTGGGGRYLVLHLPQQRQLAVFDANEARIVKYLSAPEENLLFAAGMKKLMVVLPDSELIQRWDLTTLQREVTAPLVIREKIFTVAMGAATDGPLVLGGPALGGPGGLPLRFLDVPTLKEVTPQNQEGRGGMVGTHPQYPHSMRISADGHTIAMWNEGLSPMGLQTVLLNGTGLSVHHEHTTVGQIFPSPDGRTLYTGNGLFTSELKPLGAAHAMAGTVLLPAVEGDYYVSILPAADGQHNKTRVAVHQGRDTRPLVSLPDLQGLEGSVNPYLRQVSSLTLDKRVFLIAAVHLLVTIPATAERLYLHRFDLNAAMEKSGIDYLYVVSQPLATAVKGQTYTYPIRVKSKAGGVTFRLEAGPPGMEVSPSGRLSWKVPADFDGGEADVILTIADRSGQEVFHKFSIKVANPGEAGAAPPEAAVEQPRPRKPGVATPTAEVPAAPAPLLGSIRPAPLKGTHEERALPSSVVDVCVGGGGRYLFLHLQRQRMLGVFDCNQARVIKYLSVAEDNVKMAACQDKLVVVLPQAKILKRYALPTLQQEVTVPVPFAGPVDRVLLGAASQGPLILLGAGEGLGRSRAALLDPYTLNPLPDVQLGALDWNPSQSVWRISGDGRVLTSYQPNLSPQGHTIRLRSGNEFKRFGLAGDVAGHLAPGPEGRFVYTARGVYTSEGKPVGKLGSYSDGSRFCLPAAEGESFYLHIDVPGFPHGDREGRAAKVFVHLAGDDRPLAELKEVEVPAGLNTWGRELFGIDQRFFLVPSARLLVVLPATQDRLQLYRVDADEILAKSDHDYLVVLSRPPQVATRGQRLTYTPQIKSRRGGVKLKLESGPEGMTLSPQGQLSWSVPRDFTESQVDVILSVTDATGQEIFHSFGVTVRDQ